jgi:hypothetical protein
MATTTSYNITEISAKEQSFDDGNVIKECSAVAGNSFKHKTEICNAIKEVQSSRCTVSRTVGCLSNDNEQQPRQNLEICEFLSLQLNESADA